MKTLVLSAAAIAASVSARFPAPEAGQLGSLNASAATSAQPGTLEGVDAMGVRSFTDVSGNLQWVRATCHFGLAGDAITQGTYVQVREEVAKELVRMDRVTIATEDEVNTALAAEVKAKK